MQLVEKHIYKPNHRDYQALDELCFLSKNLYNATLYKVRQQYFKDGSYLDYYKVNKQFTQGKQADYIALPAKISKWVQMLVDQNYKSFFALLKHKDPTVKAKARIPDYLPKYGRQMVFIPKDALSVKGNHLTISPKRINITIKTQKVLSSVQFIRIVPKSH